MAGDSLRRFYYKHKNGIKIAGLCVIILCSIGVLCAVRYRQAQKIRPALERATEDTQDITEVTLHSVQAGIKGSEIKAQLSDLKEADKYAVVVATKELMLKRMTKESAYLVYPMDEEKYPEYVTASDGNRYMLFGVNYGCVLYDSVLYSMGGISGDCYTIAGFMEESEYAERNNYKDGTKKTAVTRNKYHPYIPEESLFIADEDVFLKGYIYDKDEKEIGCIYYADAPTN